MAPECRRRVSRRPAGLFSTAAAPCRAGRGAPAACIQVV